MFKHPHKVIGKEKTVSNIIFVTDTIGRCQRQELDWAALTAAQQALIDTGKARRKLGQTG